MKAPMQDQYPQTWTSIVERMPKLLKELQSRDFLVHDGHGRLPHIPDKGVYVFYENGKPLYVGRSDRMRERLLEHGRDSSSHNSASFAFLWPEKNMTDAMQRTGDQPETNWKRTKAFSAAFRK